jgi:hypothetical protein
VRYPDQPLFTFVRFRAEAPDNVPASVVLEYRSEWPTTLLLAVSERDGSRYQAELKLEGTKAWQRVTTRVDAFELQSDPDNADENDTLDVSQLDSIITFYDGTGVTAPTTPFTNQLAMTPPVIAETKSEPAAPID